MQQQAPDSNFPHPMVAWYSTVLLAFMYWLSILDRTIISLLVDPIKNDLGISDVQFGMLHGLAFAITFSVFGLIAGSFADRFNRRLLIFFSVSIWSVATAACGMAQSFWHLLLARVGVGAGEAGLNPCATSIISDLFPSSKLTMALAVYAFGASVGSGCAFIFGGMLIDLVSQSSTIYLPLFGDISSGKSVFISVGVPGVLVAFLSFTMPEPRRLGVSKQAKPEIGVRDFVAGYKALFAFMRERKTFFTFHYIGFGFASLCFIGGAAWYPAHMARTFGWDGTQIGLSLGLTMIIAGFIGNLLCGKAVGVLYQKGYRDAQFRCYAACLLIALPVGFIALTSDNSWVFLGGIGVFLTLLSPLNAVYVSALNLVTPNELRGAGVAFYSASIGLLALSLGPIFIALISDYVYGGDAIGLGMATLFVICCPIAALSLMFGTRSMREAVLSAE